MDRIKLSFRMSAKRLLTVSTNSPDQASESYESAERRFRPWLEESLTNALTLWRKSL